MEVASQLNVNDAEHKTNREAMDAIVGEWGIHQTLGYDKGGHVRAMLARIEASLPREVEAQRNEAD